MSKNNVELYGMANFLSGALRQLKYCRVELENWISVSKITCRIARLIHYYSHRLL